MYKTRVLFLFFLGIGILQSYGQCNSPFPPALTCENAPIICNLDGYCSATSTPNAIDAPPFCGNVENNHWLAFTAGSSSLSLYFSVSNCSNEFGLQAQILSTDDCENFMPVSNCWSPAFVTDGTVNASGLTVGETYYIMVDGWSVAQCDYTILVLSGTTGVNLMAEAGETATICTGDMLVLDGSQSSVGNNYVYEWTTENGNIISGEQSLTPVINQAGTYVLEVSDITFGCLKRDTVEILATEMPIVDIASPDLLNCNHDSIVLDASASSHGDEFELLWTTESGQILSGENTLQAVVNQSGVYTLTIRNILSDCTNSHSVSVESDQTLPDVTASSDTIFCGSEMVQLHAFSNTSGVHFSWTGPNNFNTTDTHPTVFDSGIYILTATSTNGCTASTSISITLGIAPPEISLSAAPLTCAVSSTTIESEGSATHYTWTGPNGFQSNLPQPIVSMSGLYTLEASSSPFCSAIFTIEILTNTQAPIADAGENGFLNCEQPLIQLDGTSSSMGSSYSYLWQTIDGSILANQTSLSPSIDQAGLYILEVIDNENGCSATDTVMVTEDADLLQFATYEVQKPSCFDSNDGQLIITEVVGGTSPLSFSIDGINFKNNPSFMGLAAATYTLTVKDSAGCEWTSLAEIDAPLKWEVDLGADFVLEEATHLIPDISTVEFPIAEVQWTPSEGLSCDDCLTPLALPAKTTTYRLALTNANGCTVQDEIKILVGKGETVYIPNAFSPNRDGQNDEFTVYGGHGVEEVLRMDLYDYFGRPIFQLFNFEPNQGGLGWDGMFKGRLLPPATYMYVIEVKMKEGRKEIFKGSFNLIR